MPVFWDKQTKTIVNNESSEIVRFLNSEFNDFAKHPEVRHCPDLLRFGQSSVSNYGSTP